MDNLREMELLNKMWQSGRAPWLEPASTTPTASRRAVVSPDYQQPQRYQCGISYPHAFKSMARYLRWLILLGAVVGRFRPPIPFGQYPGPVIVASAQSASVGPLRVSGTGGIWSIPRELRSSGLATRRGACSPRSPRADVITYLDDRKAKGFTVIQAVLCWRDGTACMANLEGQLPFLGTNPAAPNEAYFANVDWIIDQADQRGIVVALFPIWSNA